MRTSPPFVLPALPLLPALLVALSLLVAEASAAGMICASYEYSPNLVRAMQQQLIAKGARGIKADGKWGPKSREALREFQRKEGLEESGELDEATFHALLGADVPYEGVTVKRNPTNAPDDEYRRICEGPGR